jgi:NAD(P)-dependent dehydrogenase (short-subunit alcohol dehydrogenase family)
MEDLAGKTGFVTGGASGIGFGIAKALVREGVRVVLADLRQDHLDEAVGYFESIQARRQVHPIRLDVTDRSAMADAADEVEARFGNLHILVNNAGVGIEGPLKQASFGDWDFGLGVNLGGVVNGVQILLPRIRKHGQGGHVVSTASLAGMVVMPPHMAIYAASKAAVIALMESIRGELAGEGIGVSVLCPGPIKSRIHELRQNRPERFAASEGFAAAADRLAERRVSDLWMEPDQVGELVLQGIRENRLYLVTHGEWRDAVASRLQAMIEAMPTETSPELIASLRAVMPDETGEN